MVRNPKDVAVSLYKILYDIGTETGMTWEIFLKYFFQGKREYRTNFTPGVTYSGLYWEAPPQGVQRGTIFQAVGI